MTPKHFCNTCTISAYFSCTTFTEQVNYVAFMAADSPPVLKRSTRPQSDCNGTFSYGNSVKQKGSASVKDTSVIICTFESVAYPKSPSLCPVTRPIKRTSSD